MRALKTLFHPILALFLLGSLLASVPVIAATDLEAQDGFAKARSKSLQPETDHSSHAMHGNKSQIFHGIFYGYLPCNDCDGVKTTLSLKQNNSYLLVTQPARASSREYYERGKYDWNDEHRTVVLTPNKGGTDKRYFYIEDEGTLIQLNDNGTRITAQADRYILRSSDTYKSREVHIH